MWEYDEVDEFDVTIIEDFDMSLEFFDQPPDRKHTNLIVGIRGVTNQLTQLDITL